MKKLASKVLKAHRNKGMKVIGEALKDNKKWEAIIKDLVESAGEEVESEYELFSMQVEEVESESRGGFIPYTNGGFKAVGFQDVNSAIGSGNFGGGAKADKAINGIADYNRELAQEQFFNDNKEKLASIGITKKEDVGYGELEDKDQSDMAEEFDELEREMGSEDTIMYEIGAFYYEPDNRKNEIEGKHTIYVYGVINWEAPYHRSNSKYEEVMKNSGTFSFTDEKDLKKQLKKRLDKIVKEL